ncbi:MAG: hypothetical protein U5L96_06555 [Owenweeksia sp.]|nr:hypothetical protein [Owenweeksia sp.]
MKAPIIVDVTPENAAQHGLYCIKDFNDPGSQKKFNWFKERYKEGLRFKMMEDKDGKPLGFIEYIPADYAWRPVHAPSFMFIHCTMVYPDKNKHQGHGSRLLEACEEDAEIRAMAGVCSLTSKGSWIATQDIFEKNGYGRVDSRGRFELMSKKWDQNAADPVLINWEASQANYKGWHLLYADQCPWHNKAAEALIQTAREFDVTLKVKKLNNAAEAKAGPSGFGVFSLLHDGKLLEDHYISATRFRNILNKELAIGR